MKCDIEHDIRTTNATVLLDLYDTANHWLRSENLSVAFIQVDKLARQTALLKWPKLLQYTQFFHKSWIYDLSVFVVTESWSRPLIMVSHVVLTGIYRVTYTNARSLRFAALWSSRCPTEGRVR